MRYFGPDNPLGLDNWLKGYIHLTRLSESPLPFHFWTGVATIAGALRRQVWIEQRIFQWTPNFYIILLGPPGVVAKSTSIGPGMAMLRKLGVHFGPPSMTWQALTLALFEALYEKKYFDVHTKSELKLTTSAITIPVSELGTLLKPDDSALVDVLIDLWDGRLGDWGHKTKTTGEVTIKNPWVNIIGCTTPAWMQQHIPEYMIGGGLMSRILFVYGDRKRRLVPYPSEEVSDEEYKATEAHLFTDLCEIASLAGEYKLSPSAIGWGSHWYEVHHDPSKRPAHLASDRYGGYIARKQTHIHKLALVLAASKSSKLIIEEEDLKEAETLISSIEPDMQRAFESIGVVDESRRSNEIVAFVRHYGKLTIPDLWKLCQRNMELRDFKETLKAILEAKQLKPTTWVDAEGIKSGVSV